MKQISQSPEITRRIQAAAGPDVPANSLAVYEAIAFNTLPIRKDHFLYKGAVASDSLIVEMAASLSKESIPIMTMHDTTNLPVGKMFYAEPIRAQDGSLELRALFYIPRSETQLVEKLDLSVVDQVSVSVLSQQALCSVCGFDFFGADSADSIFTLTCTNGHTLHQDGVHLNLIGLSQWHETSLVHKGGAQNARIVPRDQSVFGQPALQRLAASGFDPSALVLTAIPHREKKMEFDVTQFTTDLANTKVALGTAEANVVRLTAERDALTAQITERDTKIEELTAQLGADVANVTAAKDKAVAALKDMAVRLMTMAGEVDPKAPETVDELVTLIDTKKTELAAVLVTGGRSAAADTAEKEITPASLGAFRPNR